MRTRSDAALKTAFRGRQKRADSIQSAGRKQGPTAATSSLTKVFTALSLRTVGVLVAAVFGGIGGGFILMFVDEIFPPNAAAAPLPFPLPPRPPTQGAGSRRSVSNSGAGRTTA